MTENLQADCVQSRQAGFIQRFPRYYDPTTGRFISRDSYAGKNEDPLSLNRYTYCQNNSLIFVDPSGKYSVVIWANYPDEKKSVSKNNKKQAEIIAEQYEEKYGGECYVYEVGTAEDFVTTWNSLDDSEPIDAIQFIGHGTAARETDDITYGYGNIYFGDGSKLYAETYINNIAGEVHDKKRRVKGINDYTIDDVYGKNVGSIYFSACNTANQDFTAKETLNKSTVEKANDPPKKSL